jgi:hypothetical protein
VVYFFENMMEAVQLYSWKVKGCISCIASSDQLTVISAGKYGKYFPIELYDNEIQLIVKKDSRKKLNPLHQLNGCGHVRVVNNVLCMSPASSNIPYVFSTSNDIAIVWNLSQFIPTIDAKSIDHDGDLLF